MGMGKVIALLLAILLCTTSCSILDVESSEVIAKPALVVESEGAIFSRLYDQNIYSLTNEELKLMVEHCRRKGAPQYARYQEYFPSITAWLTLAQLYQLELNRRETGTSRVPLGGDTN